MKATISSSVFNGNLHAPASKSIMQRVCAAALLRKGTVIIHNPGNSDDDKAALDIIGNLGANVIRELNKVTITSNGIQPISKVIDCSESGLSARMFTSIAALSSVELTLQGRGSLLKRPFAFFDTIFPQLNVSLRSNNGYLPLKIRGPLHPNSISIDASLSSQFLTGILMAYSAAGANDVIITSNNLQSKPYIDLTLQIMKEFGLSVPINNNYESFEFKQQRQLVEQQDELEYTIEGDWSGAAFLMVAAAIAGSVTITGLKMDSFQGDKAIVQLLKNCGADILYSANQVTVHSSALNSFLFDATDTPDLFPPLVALASYCNGTSVIQGVSRLVHKESNRAITLQQEFKKLGVDITISADAMTIQGGNKLSSATVDSHHDHRIAMACAVAGLNAEGDVIIENAEAVNKSYPAFWTDLQKARVTVSLIDK